jgi:MerR family transcriptional regulator, copper efflux regulator
MADTEILSRDEFLARAELAPADLERWIGRGLLRPAGRTEGDAPFFTPAQLETVRKISTLAELGYDEAGILAIVKKVGLPRAEKEDPAVRGRLRTVGELAELCGINTRTIKHWEEKELLAPDARSEGGFRLYGEASVVRCRRIQDLQNLGYSLEQIRGNRALLEDAAALGRAMGETLGDASLEAMGERNVQLRERLDAVRGSAKRFDEQLKRHERLFTTLRTQLNRRKKAEAAKRSKKVPDPA